MSMVKRSKYLEGDPSSKRGATTKVIGIQLYQEGMRVRWRMV